MKSLILSGVVVLLSGTVSRAQIKNAKIETVKIYGNCSICETTIEKAGTKKKQYKTDWNVDTKMAAITYDSKKTDVDAVLKSIALSGYDNPNYLAPDDAYAKLPVCCKYNREKKVIVKTTKDKQKTEITTGTGDHSGHNKDNMAKDPNQTSQLKAVFDYYFALKDALVKTDGIAASSKASVMIDELNTVKMEMLNPDEHSAWMKMEKNLKFHAQHIKENNDPAHQRDHFMYLSKGIYELIKTAKPAEIVYYQFCPMANDGKGANWLSREKLIKNPYYGSEMLSCGKVVETIKP